MDDTFAEVIIELHKRNHEWDEEGAGEVEAASNQETAPKAK